MSQISSIYKLKVHKKKRKQQKEIRRSYKKAKPFFTSDSGVDEGPMVAQRLDQFIKTNLKKLPKSEQWFHSLYCDYNDMNDYWNKPLGLYIPDVANYRYKYVIEIDGSIHKLPRLIKKDKEKDLYYESKGYKVIRVTAYDENQFRKAIHILKVIRKELIIKDMNKFDTQEKINNYLCRACIS